MTDCAALVRELEEATLAFGIHQGRSPMDDQLCRRIRCRAARDALHAALSAQSTGSGGVAAEPVAWAYEWRQSDIGRWRQTASEAKPCAEPNVRNIRPLYEHPPVAATTPPAGGGETKANDLNSLSAKAAFEMLPDLPGEIASEVMALSWASEGIPPDDPTDWLCDRHGEVQAIVAKWVKHSPASSAGDLNSLSARATRGLLRVWTSAYGEGPSEHVAEISGIYLVADSELAAPDDDAAFVLGLWNAFRSGRLVEAAPASALEALPPPSPDQNRGEPDQGGEAR